MAHKKAGGSSRNGRDTQGQRRGVKKFGGENVIAGNILAVVGENWNQPCVGNRLHSAIMLYHLFFQMPVSFPGKE